jgi:sulfate adenylyltransferase large subunit
MDLLRFATAGSVDDGKSTLIGRLLHDTKTLFDDQLEAAAITSARRGHDGVDLALITDGLRAEREQGITIDVAYRYFATPTRTFIIADTPGHTQYTRNMVTGASTADLALVLVDARHGLQEQSRRHTCVAATLGIRHLALIINKMDLVEWSESVYDALAEEFVCFAARLGFDDVAAVPVSALLGDNVVDASTHMPWYAGPTLLEHLERVPVGVEGETLGARLPVQYVIRPRPGSTGDERRYAGTVAAGTLRTGDDVVVLPSGNRTTIAAIDTFDGPLTEAESGSAITVRLADDLDVGRGDVLALAGAPPSVVREVDAVVCWFGEKPLRAGDRVTIKHNTRTTRAITRELIDHLDVNSLARRDRPDLLGMNDLGTVRFATATPLAIDRYADSRATGSFIVIDDATNVTVGAGMIVTP